MKRQTKTLSRTLGFCIAVHLCFLCCASQPFLCFHKVFKGNRAFQTLGMLHETQILRVNIRRERFSGALNNLLFHNRQRHSYMCRKTNVCCSIVITLQGQCVGWVYSCGKLSITDGIVGHRQNPRFVTSHKTRTTPQRCPPFARMDICTHLNTN